MAASIRAEALPDQYCSQSPPAGPQALPQQEQGTGKGPQHGHNLINDSVSRIEIRVKSSLSCSAALWWCTHPQAAARAPCTPRDADKQYFSPDSLHIHQSFQSRTELGLFSRCHGTEATGEPHGGGSAVYFQQHQGPKGGQSCAPERN